MPIPKDLERILIKFSEKYSFDVNITLLHINNIARDVDGFYIFDLDKRIDAIFFSKVFIYSISIQKDEINSVSRHISDITKITNNISKKSIDVGIFFDYDETIEFNIPMTQYKTWTGVYKALNDIWAKK